MQKEGCCWNLYNIVLHYCKKRRIPIYLMKTVLKRSLKRTLNAIIQHEESWLGSDLSTWKNCLPWEFDCNSIQNTNILGDAFGNSLTSSCCYLALDFLKVWPSNSNIATELVLPGIDVAITKIKHYLMVVWLFKDIYTPF